MQTRNMYIEYICRINVFIIFSRLTRRITQVFFLTSVDIMGVCESSLNASKHPSEHLFIQERQTNIEDNQLAQAKQVIDALNLDVDSLERELQELKAQVSKERLLRNEEQDKLRAAQVKIEKMESEKDELSVRLSESIALINAQPIVPETYEAPPIGRYQSPINIFSTTHSGHTRVLSGEEFVQNPLTFQYPEYVQNCTISYNGQNMQINIDSSNKCSVCIKDKSYALKGIYFRTPSEHTIDSKQHQMEMQMVHMNEQNEIAVLAFLFSTLQKYQRSNKALSKCRTQQNIDSVEEESDDMETDDEMNGDDEQEKNSDKGNDFLDQFWSQLPSGKMPQDVSLKNAISFDYLFETSSNALTKNAKDNAMSIDMEIYEYAGSLSLSICILSIHFALYVFL